LLKFSSKYNPEGAVVDKLGYILKPLDAIHDSGVDQADDEV
jgi:hypothetical protein